MRGQWGVARVLGAALAVVLVATSFGTAWTSRTTSIHSLVDPSLRAGEVALVHTTGGHAGALSQRLSALGAVDIETETAADTVIARLSPLALAAVAADPNVALATRDTTLAALGAPPTGQRGAVRN